MKPKMAAAVKHVFETSELLELIIASLPPEDIFILQAVCKRWRTVMATSPAIQSLTFRRAGGQPIKPSRIHCSRKTSLTIPEYNQELTINPGGRWRLRCNNWKPGKTCNLSFFMDFVNEFTDVDYSFLDLYLTSPPYTTASILVVCYEGEAEGAAGQHVRCSIQDSNGIKISLLVDVAEKIVLTTGRKEFVRRFLVACYLKAPVSEDTKEACDADEERIRKLVEAGAARKEACEARKDEQQ